MESREFSNSAESGDSCVFKFRRKWWFAVYIQVWMVYNTPHVALERGMVTTELQPYVRLRGVVGDIDHHGRFQPFKRRVVVPESSTRPYFIRPKPPFMPRQRAGYSVEYRKDVVLVYRISTLW